jgi:hypothetical protein
MALYQFDLTIKDPCPWDITGQTVVWQGTSFVLDLGKDSRTLSIRGIDAKDEGTAYPIARQIVGDFLNDLCAQQHFCTAITPGYRYWDLTTGKSGYVIQPEPLVFRVSLLSPTLWQSYSFAPEWFRDALHEARTGQDHHSRRREILFAVCAAESYLLEWVRDEVLKRNFSQLENYFPLGNRRGLTEKWKEVPKQLCRDGHLSGTPNLGGTNWSDFQTLICYRNGLVHARASRPETKGQADDENPIPSKTTLDSLSAGWAVCVIVALIRDLHNAVGTPPPSWLDCDAIDFLPNSTE